MICYSHVAIDSPCQSWQGLHAGHYSNNAKRSRILQVYNTHTSVPIYTRLKFHGLPPLTPRSSLRLRMRVVPTRHPPRPPLLDPARSLGELKIIIMSITISILLLRLSLRLRVARECEIDQLRPSRDRHRTIIRYALLYQRIRAYTPTLLSLIHI